LANKITLPVDEPGQGFAQPKHPHTSALFGVHHHTITPGGLGAIQGNVGLL